MPLTLKDACEIYYRGRITVASLKAEHAKGNLDIFKTGRAYFTTLASLREMKAKCRVEAPARSSGSINREEPGLSSTVEADAARDALLMNLDRLKKPSANISRHSIKSGIRQHRTLPTFYQPTRQNTSRIK